MNSRASSSGVGTVRSPTQFALAELKTGNVAIRVHSLPWTDVGATFSLPKSRYRVNSSETRNFSFFVRAASLDASDADLPRLIGWRSLYLTLSRESRRAMSDTHCRFFGTAHRFHLRRDSLFSSGTRSRERSRESLDRVSQIASVREDWARLP